MRYKVKAKKVKEAVREIYARAALSVKNPRGSETAGCCSSASGCSCGCDIDFTKGAYSQAELAGLPEKARLASLGCGNPIALAAICPGEVVLDLGSGGGIDVLLSAQRVGSTGKVYGLDMTDEMLALARENQRKSGLTNVEFLQGDIEEIPLPDNHVDVIISNCVVNLAADKEKVLKESLRVLKPGGRFAITDIVFQGDKNLISHETMQQLELWASCMAGALTDHEYIAHLQNVGFVDASIQVIHEYTRRDMQRWIGNKTWPDGGRVRVVSAFVRAVKPQ